MVGFVVVIAGVVSGAFEVTPSVIVPTIIDTKVSLRQPVALQHFTEQLVQEVLTQLLAQAVVQLTV